MAQRTQVITVSDISNVEVGDGERVTFSYRGVDYVIDLTMDEAKDFDKAIALYTGNGQRLGGRKQRTGSGSASTDKEQLAKIREWAGDNGFKVAERGRIRGEVLEAYDKAHRR